MLKEKLYFLKKSKKLCAATIAGIALLIVVTLILVIHFTQTPDQHADIATKAPVIHASPTAAPVLTPTPTTAPTPVATATPIPTPETTVPPTEKPTERPTQKPTPVPTTKPTPKPTKPPIEEPTPTMQIIYAQVLYLTVPPSAQPGETISMPAYPNMNGTYTIAISCPGCEEISETYSLSMMEQMSLQWTVPLEAQAGTATIRTITDTWEEVYHITITHITE